jgi:hypothetical protein
MLNSFFKCAALVYLFGAQLAHASESTLRLLDGFDHLSEWKIQATDQVKANLRTVNADAAGNQAMCIDYDFNGVSGYAAASRAMSIDFPEQFAFDLQVKGTGGRNHLQIKLVDASGENVWWQNKTDFLPSSDWQTLRIKKRHIDFAWGPALDHHLRHTERLELVLAAGKDGGKGALCFNQLRFQELDVKQNQIAIPKVIASSGQASAHFILDGKRVSAWQSDPGTAQILTLDFQHKREFGGIVLHWGAKYFASRYLVQLSDDGQQWHTVHEVHDGNGGVDPLDLPESDARFLRLVLQAGPEKFYRLQELEVKDLAFGSSTNTFMQAIAKQAPRGRYPRGFMGEQAYWTILGIDGGDVTGLVGEDGAIESHKGGFSVEPFILGGKAVLSWANVTSTQSLREGYLPIPKVTWKTRDLSLDVVSFASGTVKQSQILARYTVRNSSKHAITRTLALAIRPFQVNPPAQFLNTAGGASDIKQLDWNRQDVLVNASLGLRTLSVADKFIASSFDAGQITERLDHVANLPEVTSLHDAAGRASAALLYHLSLAPGESKSIVIALPMTGSLDNTPQVIDSAEQYFSAQEELVATSWREKLNRVQIRLPAAQQQQFDVMRSALSHILISRAGPALQPGTRSYARSWIRDGAMMTEGLLRLGQQGVASDFVDWIAPFQFANGKVPCCVDLRGADPVPENDSHGQLIFSIAQLYRYSKDEQQLAQLWPHVERAIDYMEQLRASEQSVKNQATPYYGLMPASISHEGYSAKPMHSYWDDFWALRGYKDAVVLADVMGKKDQVLAMTKARDAFQADLKSSISASVKLHGIDFIPGAADLGDFDATSTTIALSPADAGNIIEPQLLKNTFERYWHNFIVRRDTDKKWDAYTPYEIRTVGSFVRLGWPDRAQSALSYFYRDLRPAGWNQWAEVVGREYRKERFIGDMPHAWISSDYLRSFLDVFAWEDESNQSIVLAAGVPEKWLDGEGIAVDKLRTSYGVLSYQLRRTKKEIILHVDADFKVPHGGISYKVNESTNKSKDGSESVWTYREGLLKILSLPADIRLATLP